MVNFKRLIFASGLFVLVGLNIEARAGSYRQAAMAKGASFGLIGACLWDLIAPKAAKDRLHGSMHFYGLPVTGMALGYLRHSPMILRTIMSHRMRQAQQHPLMLLDYKDANNVRRGVNVLYGNTNTPAVKAIENLDKLSHKVWGAKHYLKDALPARPDLYKTYSDVSPYKENQEAYELYQEADTLWRDLLHQEKVIKVAFAKKQEFQE